MTTTEQLIKISDKLIEINTKIDYLRFNRDWNGFTGKRGVFYGGGRLMLDSQLIASVMLERPCVERDLLGIEYDKYNPPTLFPDAGIGIFNLDNKLIDTIYWNENPEKILTYFM
jgi:hypothetical protein